MTSLAPPVELSHQVICEQLKQLPSRLLLELEPDSPTSLALDKFILSYTTLVKTELEARRAVLGSKYGGKNGPLAHHERDADRPRQQRLLVLVPTLRAARNLRYQRIHQQSSIQAAEPLVYGLLRFVLRVPSDLLFKEKLKGAEVTRAYRCRASVTAEQSSVALLALTDVSLFGPMPEWLAEVSAAGGIREYFSKSAYQRLLAQKQALRNKILSQCALSSDEIELLKRFL